MKDKILEEGLFNGVRNNFLLHTFHKERQKIYAAFIGCFCLLHAFKIYMKWNPLGRLGVFICVCGGYLVDHNTNIIDQVYNNLDKTVRIIALVHFHQEKSKLNDTKTFSITLSAFHLPSETMQLYNSHFLKSDMS